MMEKEYIIFCDESVSRGRYYSNFYGGLIIGSSKYQQVSKRLNDIKLQLNFYGEVKWEKVSENYLNKYIVLIQSLFKEMENGNLKIRIMFTHNTMINEHALQEDKQLVYFKLYYQFIKHAFGLRFIPSSENGVKLRLFFDVFPHGGEKIEQFKGFLLGLQKWEGFKQANIIIPKEHIAEVKSHDHVLLQCLDIVLGSMNFRLNDKHKELIPGTHRRGKKTKAKEELYKIINKEIGKLYPHFNVGVSTGEHGDITNRWKYKYSHWCFTSTGSTYDGKFAKRQ